MSDQPRRRRLTELLEPPPPPLPPARSWDGVRAALGLAFSEDLVWFMDTYGGGSIDAELSWDDPRSAAFDDVARANAVGISGCPPELRPFPPFPGPGTTLLALAADNEGIVVFAEVTDETVDDDRLWIGDMTASEWLKITGPFYTLVLKVIDGDSELLEFKDWDLEPVFYPHDPAALPGST